MANYLGEFETTRGLDMTPTGWALMYIGTYGQVDGEHHQLWVLDQVARILKGTKVLCHEARWDDGTTNFRFTLDEPTKEYIQWVSEMRNSEDGPET